MFAWIYEITPEGIKRESEVERHESITPQTGRRMDRAIIAVLGLALIAFAVDRFVFVPRREAANATSAVASRQASSPASAAESMPSVNAEKSIAVLPFVNMSSDKEQDYFSDGISEELLNLLAKIPQLHVAARTSSFSFKGKEAPIPEIARTLLVANVLEGSVRKSGDTLRITAQLVRAADGFHLWSETYDRKLDDIFKIQDEISAKVVEQLKLTLLGAAPKARTTNPQAFALYLQARELSHQQNTDAFRQSDALYQQALAIDPRYAPAWTGLAQNLLHETQLGMVPMQEAFAGARESLQKALAIDPDYAPAHAGLGFIAMFGEHDFDGAAQHLERALALAPGDVEVLRNAAVFLSVLGRIDESLSISKAIVRHDPVNGSVFYNMSIQQRYLGQWDAALASLRTVLSLNPGRGQAHAQVADVLLLKGDAAGARAAIEQETSDVWREIIMPMIHCALGRKADADAAFASLITRYEKDAPANIAQGYAFCGNADKAFEWLDRAIVEKDPGLGEIVAENFCSNIHSDPRWLPFLRKIGMAPEQLAKIEFKVTLPAEWQAEATVESATKPAETMH
jgi:TolB-like protein/Flp pilus assembly protein TadD